MSVEPHWRSITPSTSGDNDTGEARWRSATPPPVVAEPPEPVKGSGQRKGETPFEFIARRKEELVNAMNHESESMRQARVSGREHAKLKIPSNKLACYTWEAVAGGHLLRTKVPKRLIEDTWGCYSEDAKVYDEYRNEWDLWNGFYRSGGPTGYEEADFEKEQYMYPEENMSIDTIYELRPAEVNRYADTLPHASREEMEQHVERIGQDYTENDWQFNQDPIRNLHLRLGFTDDKKQQRIVDEAAFRKSIHKLYLDRNRDISNISPWSRFNICTLVETIEKSRGNVLNVPESLCDLHKYNPRHIVTNTSESFVVELREVINSRKNNAADQRENKRARYGAHVYLIVPNPDTCKTKQPWELMVTDPASALECMRFKGTIFELVCHLLDRGIPFQTLRLDRQSAMSSTKLGEWYRPLRVSGSSIKKCDYMQYVRRVKELLYNNKRVRRAAMMRGGIIWRLARMYGGDVHCVLEGTSEEYLDLILEMTRDRQFTTKWYADQLTEDEEDIICGVYRSSEGKGNLTG